MAGGQLQTVIKHYEMTSDKFGTAKSYESYRAVSKFIAKHGIDGAAADFAQLMPWGTPDMVLEKLAFIKKTIDARASCSISATRACRTTKPSAT